MKLTKFDNKFYITLWELKTLGFDYPKTGTSVLVRKHFLGSFDNYYKFHEKKQGWDGVFVSPFLSDVGKLNLDDSQVYIELSPKNFNI